MVAWVALLGGALWVAWRPAETAAETPLLVAALLLLLAPAAWRESDVDGVRSWLAALLATAGLVACRGLCGIDPGAAIETLSLGAAACALIWLASRSRCPAAAYQVLAWGLALLALWGLWQVTVGFERAVTQVELLAAPLRANAIERLESGRAFASLPLPGHLAVLLATALPLLLPGLRRRRTRLAAAGGLLLCTLGLVLTRSPIGLALALGAVVVLFLRRRQLLVAGAGVLLAVMLMAAVALRGDVTELEPLSLRLDNWRTATVVFSSAPLTGVGLGGFGQAAQTVPLTVGNRPAHAHCLPLEWAAELGVVGIVLVLLASAALIRLLVRLWPESPELAVAVAIVPLHNLVDFSLYVSGVALPWAVLVGWAVAELDHRTDPPRPPRGRVVVVAVAAAVVAAALLHTASVVVERSAAGAGDPAARFSVACDAHSLAPWRKEALITCARLAVESGDEELARAAAELVDRWRWLSPRSAAMASLRGHLAERCGDVPTALAEAWFTARSRDHDDAARAHLEQLTTRVGEGQTRAR